METEDSEIDLERHFKCLEWLPLVVQFEFAKHKALLTVALLEVSEHARQREDAIYLFILLGSMVYF